jgi:hypothetical protein
MFKPALSLTKAAALNRCTLPLAAQARLEFWLADFVKNRQALPMRNFPILRGLGDRGYRQAARLRGGR